MSHLSLSISLRSQVLAAGYGVHSSGVSLFIAANVCTDVLWRALSPLRVYTSVKGRGVVSECYGVLPALVQALFTTVTHPKRGINTSTPRLRCPPEIVDVFFCH